jgi:hypothetical protein
MSALHPKADTLIVGIPASAMCQKPSHYSSSPISLSSSGFGPALEVDKSDNGLMDAA